MLSVLSECARVMGLDDEEHTRSAACSGAVGWGREFLKMGKDPKQEAISVLPFAYVYV